VTLIIERGPPAAPNAPGQTKMEGISGPGKSAYSAQNTAAPLKSEYAELPDLQRRILEFIHSQSNLEEGVHISLVARAVAGPNFDSHQISTALEKLMDDGFVFTTVDDSHFQITA